MAITAQDVNKLRQMTGAGMMDCKKALTEADGDFENAVDILRKKGQKVSASRADRETKEGVVVTRLTNGNATGILLSLTCETDFVAKNEGFGAFANSLIDAAVSNGSTTTAEVLALPMEGSTIAEKIIEMTGKIGEKIELSRYEMIEAPKVIAYNHPGNRLASMVGLSSATAPESSGKDVAMQIAAMSPVAIDKGDVDSATIERELEIAKEQIRAEGKPEEMVEKIAAGKLNKFYQESTLLNQAFIKEDKKSVGQYLDSVEKGLTVSVFKRVQIG